MRKYILISSLFLILCSSIFSQIGNPEPLRRQLDSLRNILPTLRDSARIDCMIMMSDLYNYLPMQSLKHQIDSSWPLALQANNEARKLGYKKGIAYSLLRMGECEDTKDDMTYNGKNDNDPVIIAAYNSCQKYFNESIAIANEIKEYPVLGYAYFILAWLADKRGQSPTFRSYMDKCIYNYEKARTSSGNYKEFNSAECRDCIGNEAWLGIAYRALGNLSDGISIEETRNYFNKSVEYLKKADNKIELANTYFWGKNRFFRMYDFVDGEIYAKKMIALCQDLGKDEDVLREYNNLCSFYLGSGNFENGLEYATKSVHLAEKLAKQRPTDSLADWYRNSRGQAFFSIGAFYAIAGDYETALNIFRKGKSYYHTDSASLSTWKYAMGEVFRRMGKYDSAFYYLNPFETIKQHPNQMAGSIYLSNLYIDIKQYDRALPLLQAVINYTKTRNGPYAKDQLGRSQMLSAAFYLGKNDFKTALKFSREGLSNLKLIQSKLYMIDSYHQLSHIFYSLGINDSAYFYLNQYTLLRDSLLTRQFYFRLNSYKKEADEERKTSQINILNKDNQLKNQQLKQQAQLRNFLLLGLLGLAFIAAFIYRNLSLKRKNDKLKNEQIHTQLRQRTSDLEMQALRAQMNPHFIFNCLSSINRFILKNETEAASDYLTRFSRLIRMVLIHSQAERIVLKDELEMLRLYLDMEQLRFKNSFDYNISFTNSIDPENIFIPPLLFQPFCENAIWHGLMPKEERGYLEIKLSLHGEYLNCIISDNGVGRKKAAELKSHSGEMHKSVGLKITAERLALMNEETGLKTSYTVEDILDWDGNTAGTRVNLNILYKDQARETVKEPAV